MGTDLFAFSLILMKLVGGLEIFVAKQSPRKGIHFPLLLPFLSSIFYHRSPLSSFSKRIMFFLVKGGGWHAHWGSSRHCLCIHVELSKEFLHFFQVYHLSTQAAELIWGGSCLNNWSSIPAGVPYYAALLLKFKNKEKRCKE